MLLLLEMSGQCAKTAFEVASFLDTQFHLETKTQTSNLKAPRDSTNISLVPLWFLTWVAGTAQGVPGALSNQKVRSVKVLFEQSNC